MGVDGSSMIRTARLRAGLTQQQLAQRTGVPQSSISQYESGKREPLLATALDLFAGCGFTLTLTPRPVATPASAALFTVLEFGRHLPHHVKRDLPAMHDVWDAASRRHAAAD